MNKLITLSVWGNDPRYIIGAKRQIELAKKYYPDWTVRLYTDDIAHFSPESNLELIHVTDNTSGYFWRFKPLFESDDNIVIVRDCDGRITVREAMAVNEWLESDKAFHIFRDHEAHFEFPIIASAFGLKGKLSDSIKEKMQWFADNTHFYFNDQIFLRDHVYDSISNNVLIHDLYSGWFGESRKKLKNRYSFCGNGFDEHDMPLYPDTYANENTEEFRSRIMPIEYKFDEGVLIE